MPFTVTMPKLSPTMEEGTIAKWHKKEGDRVESGDLLLEIATDKATVEHNALDEGYLRQIVLKEGESGRVNQPIAIFTEEESESLEGYTPEGEIPEPAAEEKVETKEETPAAAPTKGVALSQPAFTPEPPLEMPSFPQKKSGKVHASPLAKHLAKKRKLDLSTVKGSGPGGRITSKDLDKAQPAGVVTFGRTEQPQFAPGSFEEIPLTPVKKVVAKRLQESKSFIPHFYVKQVIDAAPLVELREQLKSQKLKVTFNDLIIRAAAVALRSHPEINRGFNSVNQTIIQFQTVDISVAVNAEIGLITPIIRYADYKNVGEISAEVKILAGKAQTGKLQEHEYKGGSFCVSNLGMFGITEFTAVINPPQAAILAVGGIHDAPVIKEDQVVPGKTMTLVLSVDHRVIDGAQAAQYMKTLQQLCENPANLLLS